MIWLDGPLSAEPLENLKRIAMSIGYRVIRLIAMVEERSFPYIQLRCGDRSDDDMSGLGRPDALTRLSNLKPEVCL